MNQFERCQIGFKVFSSLMLTHHVKNSFILAKFMTDDRNDDCFPEQIQYFFTHTVNLPDIGLSKHNLAFVC